MVISRKLLQFITATAVAFLPLVSIASPVADSTKVVVEETHVEGTVDEEVKQVEAAIHGEAHAEPTDLKSKIKEFMAHHLKDNHDFTLFADEVEGKHFGFGLPIILWDNGMQVFSSEEFYHGTRVVEHNGNYYVLHHEKIYKTDAKGTLTEDEKTGHPTNVKPWDFSITKSVFGILLVSLLMFFLFRGLAKSYAKNGGIASGPGRLFEPLVVFIRDEIAIPNIGEKNYKKYMSYLLTLFFFILFLNLLGLTPLGFNVTGNIAITFSMAIITYLITTFTANKNYWAHIWWMPGVPWPMKIILAPIELLGTFIKPFALMIRLYANIFAGHVVLMSIVGLMFIFKSWIGSSLSFGLAFSLSILEILVALLQAYIFTMLSALYFGMGNEEHHHEEAHH